MAYRHHIWETFIGVPPSGELPEYLQKIANGGAGNLPPKVEISGEKVAEAKAVALEILRETLEVDCDPSEFELTRLSGGFTNLVFKCSLKPNQKPIVLKVEFPKSAEDKRREYEMVRTMAANNLGPKVLGFYPEGRIEELLEGRIATEEEMKDPSFAYEIGRKIAEVHLLPCGNEPKNELPSVLTRYLSRIKQSGKEIFELKPVIPIDPEKHPKSISINDLAKEIEKIEKQLEKRFSSPIHLVHNDIFMPNIMVKDGPETKKELTLIDYEFSLLCHRAADLVGYCHDLYSTLFDDISINKSQQNVKICEGYLQHLYNKINSPEGLQKLHLVGDLNRDIQTLLSEAQEFWPIWIFFWGLWHIVCFVENNTQLDYEELFRDRISAYFALKTF